MQQGASCPAEPSHSLGLGPPRVLPPTRWLTTLSGVKRKVLWRGGWSRCWGRVGSPLSASKRGCQPAGMGGLFSNLSVSTG